VAAAVLPVVAAAARVQCTPPTSRATDRAQHLLARDPVGEAQLAAALAAVGAAETAAVLRCECMTPRLVLAATHAQLLEVGVAAAALPLLLDIAAALCAPPDVDPASARDAAHAAAAEDSDDCVVLSPDACGSGSGSGG